MVPLYVHAVGGIMVTEKMYAHTEKCGHHQNKWG